MNKSFDVNNFDNICAKESGTKFHEDISRGQSKEIDFNISNGSSNGAEFSFNSGSNVFQINKIVLSQQIRNDITSCLDRIPGIGIGMTFLCDRLLYFKNIKIIK